MSQAQIELTLPMPPEHSSEPLLPLRLAGMPAEEQLPHIIVMNEQFELGGAKLYANFCYLARVDLDGRMFALLRGQLVPLKAGQYRVACHYETGAKLQEVPKWYSWKDVMASSGKRSESLIKLAEHARALGYPYMVFKKSIYLLTETHIIATGYGPSHIS